MNKHHVYFEDKGLIPYKECWDYQLAFFNEMTERKKSPLNLPKGEFQHTEKSMCGDMVHQKPTESDLFSVRTHTFTPWAKVVLRRICCSQNQN